MSGDTLYLQVRPGCGGGTHVWEPYVGDPVPQSAFAGRACQCGAVRLRLGRCDLGYEHLVQEPERDEWDTRAAT